MSTLPIRPTMLFAAAFAAAASLPGNLTADERLFTYSYEPKVLPHGALELEQWATARVGKESGVFNRWDLRTELEYGLSDDLTTALYLNLRSTNIDVDDDAEDESEFEFQGISSEWKYKVADPTADPVGFLLYGEVTTDFEELELEQKLVLGKNVGPWVFAFNAIFEEEWEFENEETEEELEIEFTAGAAFRLSSHVALGVEVREVNVFPGFEDLEHAALFAGPALHVSSERWWLTLTVLPQVLGIEGGSGDLLNLDEFERIETRLIVGLHF